MESRIDLAKHFNKLGFKIGAEIGVANGRYSEILCEEITGLKLYCVDLWKPYDGSWRTKKSQDKAYIEAYNRLEDYDVEFIIDTSLEASLVVDNEELDFVFIDGAHDFDNVMLDIILWTPKVHKGGIVAFHDYMFFNNSGVVEAVNKYCEIHKIELNVISRNKNNHNDDKQPCAWFIKK